MKHTWADEAAFAILTIDGSLDSATALLILQSLDKHATQEGRDMVIDFTGVDSISGGGLRVVLKANLAPGPAGKRLIICGPQDYDREIFELAGLAHILDIRTDRKASLT